jgi:hypothetical protein
MITCDKCPIKPDNDLCVQNLGECCGWQWWERTDESYKTCHFNFTECKENDPYIHKRNKS